MERVARDIGYFIMIVCALVVFLYVFLSALNTSIILISSDVAVCTYSGDNDYEQQCIRIEDDNDN